MPEPAQPNHAPDPHARLERLEVVQAFSERTVEQLSDEIGVLNRRLADLAKRLEGLERRLERVLDAAEPGDDADAPG